MVVEASATTVASAVAVASAAAVGSAAAVAAPAFASVLASDSTSGVAGGVYDAMQGDKRIEKTGVSGLLFSFT